ncbi:MAG: hypothetical protein U0229_00330 [Anaeromyxobacter sp.]
MAGDPVRFRLATPGAPDEWGEGLLVLGEGELSLTSPAGLALRIPLATLGDVEARDLVLHLALPGGARLELSHLGRRFDAAARALTERRRAHLDASLLLAEDGAAEADHGVVARRAPGGAEEPGRTAALRPQRTSLAVLCEGERPFVLPYGEVRDVAFDEGRYAVVLERWDGGALVCSMLGKRTDAFRRAVTERLGALAVRSARALAALAPALPPGQVRALAAALRDGVPASRAEVEAAAPGAWDAVWTRSFAGGRRPYADALAARAAGRWLCVKEVEAPSAGAPPVAAEGATLPPECDGRRLLHLFEVGRAIVAEAPGSEDVATYAFRAGPEPAARVRGLCRAFAAVQFRREPIHLSDEALLSGEHARYREVAALVPELGEARAAFLGRAIHASLDAWTAGLEEALARA